MTMPACPTFIAINSAVYNAMPGNVQQEIISKATLHEEEEE